MSGKDVELIQRFIAAFPRLDDMLVTGATGEVGELSELLLPEADGWVRWQPIRADIGEDALAELYTVIPGPLPQLYERLLLSYRWAQVDLGRLRLLASLPPRLTGLYAAMRVDTALFDTLIPAGFVQFGRGPDIDYDPICFDLRRRSNGDCRIVKFDHEEILCNRRLVEVDEPATSFRRLMEFVIEDAARSATH